MSTRCSPGRRAAPAAASRALLLAALGAAALRPAAASAQAAAPEVAFRHLTAGPDGLTSARVTAVLQDRRGFLWVGTVDGLNRYDGYGVRQYRHADDDPATIGGNVVQALFEARDGTLWVGTLGGGLSRFDPATERFTTFRHDRRDRTSLPSDEVLVLAEAGVSGLWVGTRGGLARLDLATGRFSRFAHDPRNPRSLPHDEVMALHADRQGALWVGTQNGLGRLDPRATAFRVYRAADEDARTIGAIEDRGRGGLWVGTWGSGLQVFDPRTGAFTPVPLGEGLSAVSAPANVVSSLYEDAQGTLWVGTSGGGLHELRAGGGAIAHLNDAAEPTSLSEDAVSSIFQDRQGVLWVGTYGGLDRFDRARGFVTLLRQDPSRPGSLPANNVLSVLEARDGTVWVGTDRGLARSEDAALTRFTTIPAGGGERALRNPSVNALYEDRGGTLWIGTNGGVHRLDARTGQLAHLSIPGLDVYITTFFEDREGRLWVGTLNGGLALLDRQTGRPTIFRHDSRRPSSIAEGEVWAITQDPSGALWVGTAGGLDRLDSGAGGGRFAHFRHDPADPTSLPSGPVLALRARADGTLWVGTNGGGLARYEPQRPQAGFTRYTESNSDLPSNVVRAIVEDESSFLWLSTSRGLVRFDPVPETFRPFEIGGGELTLAARRGRSGRLYFGTSAGLAAFTPGQASAVNPNPPQVALTGFRLFNEPVRPSADGPLRAAMPVAPEVRLTYDQDSFTFEFAALHFSEPTRNTYAYRLDGFDRDWVEAGTRREATYTNLSPGTYTFRVKAASADGVESEEEATVRVVVLPPWYRTTWAYGLYVLLAAGAAYGVDRVQRQRVRREERERAALAERELRAVMAETEARALRAENERKAAELEKAREVEEANTALATSNAALEASLRDLQATQTQLVQAEKLASLGQLTAGIAHEIKNPLNFVNNFAELSVELTEELGEELRANTARPVGEALAEVGDLLDDLQENARRIHEHGQRADRIVQAMLLHTRGGTGDRVRTDVNRLVEEYANLAYHGMRAKESNANVAVERAFDPQAGEAELVPQEIGRVLINLLNNAFYAVMGRARAEGPAYVPTVTVATRRVAAPDEEPQVEIRVSDNGPGIPEEVRARIFEPFFTTKPTGEGTGLGLSLAYDIVAGGHGGALDVESEEGVGTTFTLTLPALPASGGPADGAAPAAAPRATRSPSRT